MRVLTFYYSNCTGPDYKTERAKLRLILTTTRSHNLNKYGFSVTSFLQ